MTVDDHHDAPKFEIGVPPPAPPCPMDVLCNICFDDLALLRWARVKVTAKNRTLGVRDCWAEAVAVAVAAVHAYRGDRAAAMAEAIAGLPPRSLRLAVAWFDGWAPEAREHLIGLAYQAVNTLAGAVADGDMLRGDDLYFAEQALLREELECLWLMLLAAGYDGVPDLRHLLNTVDTEAAKHPRDLPLWMELDNTDLPLYRASGSDNNKWWTIVYEEKV